MSSSISNIPDGAGNTNLLAFLNLRRAWRMQVPSGPDVARIMGVKPSFDVAGNETALWFYILKEAETMRGAHSGAMLGPVGGRIVAEVFAGLLYGDPLSYVRCDPRWTPEREDHWPTKKPIKPGAWELTDLIKAAGMAITEADVRQAIDGTLPD